MKQAVIIALTLIGQTAAAQQREGVIIRCGASTGQSYYLKDEVMNPDGPNWTENGMSNGKIILVKLGEEWDIQFDDALGASGYRQDGATVVPLTSAEDLLMVGAFHVNYADIYTFDLANREVAWTSSKIGPIAAGSSVFQASCD